MVGLSGIWSRQPTADVLPQNSFLSTAHPGSASDEWRRPPCRKPCTVAPAATAMPVVLNDSPFPAAGFVHVIDDETKWDAAFGRSVLAGLLGLDANVGKVWRFCTYSRTSKKRNATPPLGAARSRGCWAKTPTRAIAWQNRNLVGTRAQSSFDGVHSGGFFDRLPLWLCARAC